MLKFRLNKRTDSTQTSGCVAKACHETRTASAAFCGFEAVSCKPDEIQADQSPLTLTTLNL